MMAPIVFVGLAFAATSVATAQEKPPPPTQPCQPYPECVLASSQLVPAAPNNGIRPQKPLPPGIATDTGLVVQGISPLDRSTFRVPSLGKGGITQ
ncbi:hypothetical protein [Bosea thiooxidans]